MYDYIKGTLERKTENYVVIDVGGVGYKIATSARSLQNAGHIGDRIMMYTHLNVREDIFELYGFITVEERSTFEMLISVSGVGPRAGLNILSSISASSLALAIVTGDAKTITTAQGVGPKLAQRIILELKDKIKNKDFAGKGSDDNFIPINDLGNEAVAALVVLGYTAMEAEKAVKAVEEGLSIEETIKQALKQMMRR